MLPQTTGKLKFKIKDMEVGDFIPCNYVSSSFSTAGQILYLGHDFGNEIPIDSETNTFSGKFYFIKVKEGMLVADRVVHNNISWNTLNAVGYTYGRKHLDGVKFRGTTNSYAYLPYSANTAPRTGMTFQATFKDWHLVSGFIMSKFQNGGYAIDGNANTLRFTVRTSSSVERAISINLNNYGLNGTKYATFTYVYGLNFAKLYINGELVITTPYSTSANIYYSTNNALGFGVEIGAGNEAGGDPYYTKVTWQEYNMWNRILTDDEVKLNYEKLDLSNENLVAAIDFRDVNGSTIYNKSNKSGSAVIKIADMVYDNSLVINSLTGSSDYNDIYSEWDRLIAHFNHKPISEKNSDLFNYNKTMSYCQDIPVIGTEINGVLSNENSRVARGINEYTEFIENVLVTTNYKVGFRPVLRYKEGVE